MPALVLGLTRGKKIPQVEKSPLLIGGEGPFKLEWSLCLIADGNDMILITA